LYIPLNSSSYGFPKKPSANGSSDSLDKILSNTSITIGGIASITGINPGKNYDTVPFVTIYEPQITGFDRRDYIIQITNASSIFATGELVEQTSGGRGIIKSANTSVVKLKRLNFENNLSLSEALEGVSSGATANIVSISLDNQPQIGLNAVVVANVQTSTGSVRNLEIVDSGFGYLQGENATFTSNSGLFSGTARVNLGKKGVSEGFYSNKNGQLSASKKVFDGEYYQEYSYEVRSSITADKYSEMLKRVLHVAGTKQFSAVVLTTPVSTTLTDISSSITEE
jgi:hypothetical protein